MVVTKLGDTRLALDRSWEVKPRLASSFPFYPIGPACPKASLKKVRASDEPTVLVKKKRPRTDRSSVTGTPHSSIAFTFCLSILPGTHLAPFRGAGTN